MTERQRRFVRLHLARGIGPRALQELLGRYRLEAAHAEPRFEGSGGATQLVATLPLSLRELGALRRKLAAAADVAAAMVMRGRDRKLLAPSTRFVVRPVPGRARQWRGDLSRALGARDAARVEELGAGRYLVRVNPEFTPALAQRALASVPGLSVSNDTDVVMVRRPPPAPDNGSPYVYRNIGADQANAWLDEFARHAHSTRHARLGAIRLAILDDGVWRQHPALRGAVSREIDIVARRLGPSSASVRARHGTACAGLIAARLRDGGLNGIAQGCHVISITVMQRLDLGDDEATETSALVMEEAFAQAKRAGAHVVNLSWGSVGDDMFVLDAVSTGIAELRAARGGRGSLVVMSAGNFHPGEVRRVDFPGRLAAGEDHAVCVSACDEQGRFIELTGSGRTRWGSDFGREVTLGAPGLGHRTTATAGDIDGYRAFSATSSAAPVVSAVAALLFAANPRAKAAQVKQWLIEGARKTGPNRYRRRADTGLAWNTRMGYGRVDPLASLRISRGLAPDG